MHRFPDGVRVDRDDGVDVGRAAAAHHDRDRQVALAAGVEHQPIASPQPFDGQLQPAQPVALVTACGGSLSSHRDG